MAFKAQLLHFKTKASYEKEWTRNKDAGTLNQFEKYISFVDEGPTIYTWGKKYNSIEDAEKALLKDLSKTMQPYNEIWYTTGKHNRPSDFSCSHPDFVSHKWETDKWVVRFSKPIVELNNIFFGYDPDAGEFVGDDDMEWVPDYENISLITFPSSLKSITEQIFDGEYGNAQKVVLSDKIEFLSNYWAGSAGSTPNAPINILELGGPIISNNKTKADSGWLQNVEESVIIKEGTQKIGNYVFAESGIEKVTIPNSVTEIGLAAFYKATNLKNIQLGNSVKTIGNSAFNYTAINTLELPSTVTSLGSTFVRNCTKLKKITVNSVVPPTISAKSFPNPNQNKYSIFVPDESLIAYKNATNWSLYSLCIHSVNEEMTSITYADLKVLKDAGKLIPGHQYRIIDYYATTTQVETTVSNPSNYSYYFDIIVTALTDSTFSEEAKATHSTNDLVNHFSKSNLSAWQLWYCFDNDVNRFAWADTSGRGVIYRMIDEFGNDCPYDFKSILFKKYLLCVTKFTRKSDNKVFKYFATTFNKEASISISDSSGAKRIYCYLDETLLEHGFSGSEYYSNEDRLFFDTPLEPIDYQDLYIVSNEDVQIVEERGCSLMSSDDGYIGDVKNYTGVIELYEDQMIYSYTFNLRTSGQVSGSFDYSIHNNDGKCFRNVIKCKYDESNDGKMYIPYVVFDNTSYGACYKNEIEAPITFKNNEKCRIVFGNHNHNNTLGRGCFNIFTGDSCYDNRFDTAVNNIVLLNKCTTNAFGTHTSNVFMYNSCMGNEFAAYCDNKVYNAKTILYNGCNFNKFGSYTNTLTLNESCSYNVFEGGNSNIVLETNSDYNWFAPYWRNNTISGSKKHYFNGLTDDVSELIANMKNEIEDLKAIIAKITITE